jgi:cell division protein FtsW
MITNQVPLKSYLRIFVTITTLLIIVGCIFVYSSSCVYALETYGSSHYFIKKQLIGLALGLAGLICIQCIPLNVIRLLSPLMLIGGIGLTSLSLFSHFSVHIHGSSRWIRLAGIAFQPSEFLKIALILYLAHFLTKRTISTYSFTQHYLPLAIILGVVSILLLRQPDFGLTVTLLTTSLCMLFIAQFPLKHLCITAACLLPAAIGLIMMKSYRLKRILIFLNPWEDPQGAGFQIIQSLIAIGSGGMWGKGITHSQQKFFYLPMQHTDFIFSIIAEEIGFVGCIFLILLFTLFLYFGIRIAYQLHNPFSRLATIGFITLITLQTIINIAVASGMAPTKGIGLPFISYGNTALMASIFMVGFIIKMARTELYHPYNLHNQ